MNLRDRLALLQLRIDHRTEVACARIASLMASDGSPDTTAPPRIVVAQMPDQLGGDFATSRVPEDHPGTCAMFYQGRSGMHCAVFPDFVQARIAARMAVDPTIGGYSSVTLDAGIKAPADADFFVYAMDWLN